MTTADARREQIGIRLFGGSGRRDDGAEPVEVFPDRIQLRKNRGVLRILLQPLHKLGGFRSIHPAIAQAKPSGGRRLDRLGGGI